MTHEELMQVSAVLEKICSESSGKGNGNSRFMWLAVSQLLLVIAFIFHLLGVFYV